MLRKKIYLILIFLLILSLSTILMPQAMDSAIEKQNEQGGEKFNNIKKEADILLQNNKYKSALNLYNNLSSQTISQDIYNQVKSNITKIRQLEEKIFNEKVEKLKKLIEKKEFDNIPKIYDAFKSFIELFKYEMESAFIGNSKDIFYSYYESYNNYHRAQAEEYKFSGDFQKTFKHLRNLLCFNNVEHENQSINREIQKIKNTIQKRFSFLLATIKNKIFNETDKNIKSICISITGDIKKNPNFIDYAKLLENITNDITEILEARTNAEKERKKYQKIRDWDKLYEQIEVSLGDTDFTKEKCPQCISGKIVCAKCKGTKKIPNMCSVCMGTGMICCNECNGHGIIQCIECKGEGKLKCKKCNATGGFERQCTACKGSGSVSCSRCGSKGSIKCKKCIDGKIKCRTCNGEKPDCPECSALGVVFCNSCQGKGYIDEIAILMQNIINQYLSETQNISARTENNNKQQFIEQDNPGANPVRQSSVAGRTYRKLAQSVVSIMTESGTGTGFIVEPSGIILTAAHVVSGRKQISIQIFNEVINVKVLREDKQIDIAVIKAEMSEYQSRLFNLLGSIPLGNSDEVEIGQKVIGIGSSLGAESCAYDGIVNSKEEKILQIKTTNLFPIGYDGGPLINRQGECIGIINNGINKEQNFIFAVTINYAKKLLGK